MKTVILFPAMILFFVISSDVFSQVFSIKGKIYDAISGGPLANANVVESKSEIGTISNRDGCFKLMLSPGQKELVISLDGYKTLTQCINLKNDTTITSNLEPLADLKLRQKAETGQSASVTRLKKGR